jgi:hypothetical protein
MSNSNDILKLQFNKGKVFRTSTAARLALPNIKGMMVYDTMTHSFWYNNGSSWQSMDDYELFAPALVKHTGELNKKIEVLMDENHELRYQLKVLMQNMKKP